MAICKIRKVYFKLEKELNYFSNVKFSDLYSYTYIMNYLFIYLPIFYLYFNVSNLIA